MNDELYQLYSDLFKDAYGSRPTVSAPLSESRLRQAIKNIQEDLDFMAENRDFEILLERETSRLRGMYVDGRIPGDWI